MFTQTYEFEKMSESFQAEWESRIRATADQAAAGRRSGSRSVARRIGALLRALY
ncbi:hypothetical protein [Cohnella sp. REN36]|uniref:hypothetical protein n=1 Tax=Cohnella sp. REN36 TaxID=2887347 RepID=UPI001D14C19A|nr:hypothetical protein [Cohnella sp. REN36]MCC3373781.1 hypothetical protein [Cohnella sp. REN36]